MRIRSGWFLTWKVAERLRNQIDWARTHNQHIVIGIQGKPGSGKSTLGLCICLGLEPDFNVENIHYNREDWPTIMQAPKGGVFLLDEGNNVASNRTWQDRSQVRLMQILNMIRQRNHVLIWATPNLARLDVQVREDLLTHKINCIPHKWRAKVLSPTVDREGEPSGWKVWKGNLTWPNLENHPIWPVYTQNKERNFAQASNTMSHSEALGDPFNGGLLDQADILAGEQTPRTARRDPVQRKVPKQKRSVAVDS